MSRKAESKFVEKALKEFRLIPHSEWERVEQVSIIGTPDLFGCIRGRCVLVEFKSRRKNPTALQQDRLNMFKKAGAYTVCCYPENFDEVYGDLYSLSAYLGEL